MTLRGEKLNYKSVAKEILKPPFFGTLSPVGTKVYRVCSIHVSVQMFRTMPIFGMSRDHNRKRLKTRTEWIVFDRTNTVNFDAHWTSGAKKRRF